MRFRRSLLPALAALLLARAAGAAAVAYPLGPASQIGGVVSATIDIVFDVVDGGVPGTVPVQIVAIGPLAATSAGSATVDWGSPGFAAQLFAEAGSLDAAAVDLGTATGSAQVALGSSAQARVRVDALSLSLESDYDAPLAPRFVSAGPWTGQASADVALEGVIRWSVEAPGGVIAASSAVALGPALSGDWPIVSDLSRLGVTGANPSGDGSQVGLAVADLGAALAAQPILDDATIVCLFGIEPNCVYEIRGFTAQLTSLVLSGVGADLVGSAPAVVPEPRALLTGCAALAALALARRRSR